MQMVATSGGYIDHWVVKHPVELLMQVKIHFPIRATATSERSHDFDNLGSLIQINDLGSDLTRC